MDTIKTEKHQKFSFKTKQARREKRYCNVLKRDYNLDISDNPTLTVAVCNAGLGCGMSRERLLQLVLPFGPIKNIVMIPGKPNSFIEFCSLDVAASVYQELKGIVIPDVKLGELFLTFVNTVPDKEDELLSNTNKLPPGLKIIQDFVTPDLENQLLDCIQWSTEDPQAGQALKHRKVRHYGYQFKYGSNTVDPNDPLDEGIPDTCHPVFQKLLSDNILCWEPDQLTVNQYQPGQGIPPHIDTHSAFEDPILSLSLGADVVMEFRSKGETLSVLLPQRSLLVMSGESRYSWTHGITPRKTDIVASSDGGVTLKNRGVRTSFTFRHLLRAPCKCAFPEYCDSQKNNISLILEQEAAKLEDLHVHQVYDKIVHHFSDTRHSPWPNVQAFVESQPCGCILLDVGCGNGKYLGLNAHAYKLGCDSSIKLAQVCQKRNLQVLACNCLYLPVRANSIDCSISIAVIHHLSTKDRRLQALREIARVLRPGGQALVYVWAREQKKNHVASSYLCDKQKQTTQESSSSGPFSLPVHTNRTEFKHVDVFVPWKMKEQQGKRECCQDKRKDSDVSERSEEVFLRYYHMFEEGELELLCELVPGIQVTRSYYDEGNWCVIFQKI